MYTVGVALRLEGQQLKQKAQLVVLSYPGGQGLAGLGSESAIDVRQLGVLPSCNVVTLLPLHLWPTLIPGQQGQGHSHSDPGWKVQQALTLHSD